jgi:ribosomal RNA-processing protein 7
MVASSSSSALLIKGYLPVRLSFPSQDGIGGGGEDMDETFFFVREHQGRSAPAADGDSNTTPTKSGSTLFVANAPVIPGVSTKILLSSIFGRFADVTRITAVQNPRAAAMAVAAANNNEDGMTAASPSSAFNWTDKEDMFQPTFLPPIFSSLEGKYAHVVFSSAKEMKKAKKELEDLMTTTTNSGKKGGSRRRSKGRNIKKGKNTHDYDDDEEQQQTDTPQALIIDKLEIQSLSDESHRQRDEVLKNALKGDSDDDTDDDEYREAMVENTNNNNKPKKYAGVLAVANRYRETSKLLRNRSKLMEECNVVMQAYEDAEEAKRKAQQVAKSEPDDDGFVTISYSGAVGSKIELEQSITATTPSRRKGNKRSRKKKEAMGSNELKDFYRFQRKDNRKRTMEDLRRQFEEDVRKVKRLKEEKEYRPF